MEKAKILKGLECCAGEEKNCDGCPYNPVGACTTTLAKDAADLLKANSEATKAKYTQVLVYTKNGNLLPYVTAKVMNKCASAELSQRMRDYYTREREIQLLCMFRWENGKCFCRIKCPVNPLPVKGEFEVPTTTDVGTFLVNNGWSFKQKIYPRMFE